MTAKIDWAGASAVVFGLLMSGKLSPMAVNPQDFIEPYPKAVSRIQKKRGLESSQLIEMVGHNAYYEAKDAAASVRGDLATWVTALERAAARHDAGVKMKKVGERLISGEDADLAVVQHAILKLETNSRQLTPLNEIQPNLMPFIKSGWQPLDYHLGGVPKKGLIVLGAPPKTGKTTLLLRIAKAYGEQKKRFTFFTMEMAQDDLAGRYIELFGKKSWEVDGRYIDVCEDRLTPLELSSVAARAQDSEGFAVDFADMMMEGEVGESQMSAAYRDLGWATKHLQVPGYVASQLSRGYSAGRIPRLTDLRMTGIAEAAAWIVLLIHNPNQIYIGQLEDRTLAAVPGHAWLIAAASRSGFNRGKVKHDGPGAILIKWSGAGGWGDQAQDWHELMAV